MPFTLPSDGLRFFDQVVERSNDLIHAGIWGGIHPAKLRAWISNFNNDLEKYFCACVLDSLIFRSDEQTNALVTQVFQRAIPDAMQSVTTLRSPVADWLGLFCGTTDPGARIVPVLKPTDHAGKSGDVIARLLRRGFHVQSGAVIEPKFCADAFNLSGVRTFIFIDDFLGSGHQFRDMMNATGLVALLQQANCVYAPLAAHADGVAFLNGLYPLLKICPGEILESCHSLFRTDCEAFTDGQNDVHAAKDFYYELLERHGLCDAAKQSTGLDPHDESLIPWNSRTGYGDLQLAYAFSHSVPDNCLPIFWWPRGRNWNPLFNR